MNLKHTMLSFLLVMTNCSNLSNKDNLKNSYWATDILIDKSTNEFTPNLILSLGDSIASIHQFGKGEKLFELPYEIKEDKLLLNKKSNPFMKFYEIKNDEILATLFPGDTTRFRRVHPTSKNKELIKKELVNHTFILKKERKTTQKMFYFDEKEIFQFSKDILKEKSDFPKLHFIRAPYYLDVTNGIPTIMIGNPISPKVNFLSNGELELTNLIIGIMDFKENNDIEINSFKPVRNEKYTLSKIEKEADSSRLVSNDWERGENLSFKFKSSGKLSISENGKTRELDWSLDDSGHLIVMTEQSGEKLYAIKNFKLSNKRIGFEFLKGKFYDLLNLKE